MTEIFDQLAAQAQSDGVQQLVVGAVVAQGEKVLLLRRPDDEFMGGIYELPSGKVEPLESIDAALRREVAEETGLVVATIGEYLGSFDYTSGSGKHSRQFTFAVDVEPWESIELQEHDAYRWASIHEDAPVTEAVAEVLARFRETRAGSRA